MNTSSSALRSALDAGEAWEEAFNTSADGFAVSATGAMQRAFSMPPPKELAQPQHCLAIICGTVAAGAQQAASMSNHLRTDPAALLASLHQILDDHFARKLALEAEGRG